MRLIHTLDSVQFAFVDNLLVPVIGYYTKIMEITEPATIIFKTSRVFGLAPFRIIRNSKGQISGYAKSLSLTIYSYSLVTLIVVLTYRGVIYDMNSDKPVRMVTFTSKVVTTLDISVVVAACVFGMICGSFCFKLTQELNKILRESDDALCMYTDNKRDRKRGLILLAVVLITILTALIIDIWVWHTKAYKKNKSEIKINANVMGYLPFYILYVFMMIFHVEFAQSAIGLGRRYRRLNNALRNSGKTEIFVVPTINVYNNKVVNDRLDVPKSKNNLADAIHYKNLTKYYVERLANVHSSLGRGIEFVSRAFGPALLVVLVSCLLHLVATSYFLLLEMIGDRDPVFTWLQLLWLCVHLFRFLLIIEPCHITFMESRKTINIVCDLMNKTKDMGLRKQLKKFWQQLLAENAIFTAHGMCTIDRQIITSYCGAIATYLVILLQFNKNESSK